MAAWGWNLRPQPAGGVLYFRAPVEVQVLGFYGSGSGIWGLGLAWQGCLKTGTRLAALQFALDETALD